VVPPLPGKPAAEAKGAVPPSTGQAAAKGTEVSAAAAGKTAALKKPASVPDPAAAVQKGAAPATPPAARAGEAAKKETFNVQAASYRERAKANETAKKLSSLGFKPRVLAVDLQKKGRWYRVVIGGFE
jgi:cell division protein FtsN